MALGKKAKGLGRGLDALFGESKLESWMKDDKEAIIEEISVNSLCPGQYQPRRNVLEANIEELADSIAKHGIMSPILVRPIGGTKYEIVAGERRFQAAIRAGLTKVPVIVRKLDDKTTLSFALIENIQREDLNAIEMALSISRLVAEFGYTQESVAAMLGKSRSVVTNLLRLLNLSDEIKAMISSGAISAGHARTLLSLDAQRRLEVAKKIVSEQLSVRQTEELVKKLGEKSPKIEKSRAQVITDKMGQPINVSLEKILNTKVIVKGNANGAGSIVIKFANQKELERIFGRISS